MITIPRLLKCNVNCFDPHQFGKYACIACITPLTAHNGRCVMAGRPTMCFPKIESDQPLNVCQALERWSVQQTGGDQSYIHANFPGN